MPPADYFKNPCHLPEEGNDEYGVRKEFFVWHWCHFLPAAGGASNFPKELVNCRMPVMPLSKVPVMEGKRGPMAAVSSEAFSYVLPLSCWEKWGHILPEKAKDHKWVIPAWDKNDASTHKCHKTLWNDGRNGQKKGQGWTPAGYEALNSAVGAIKKHRDDQKKVKCAEHKAALIAVKTANEVPLDEKEPQPKSRKRKRSAEPAPVCARITIEEEDDDDDEWVEDAMNKQVVGCYLFC